MTSFSALLFTPKLNSVKCKYLKNYFAKMKLILKFLLIPLICTFNVYCEDERATGSCFCPSEFAKSDGKHHFRCGKELGGDCDKIGIYDCGSPPESGDHHPISLGACDAKCTVCGSNSGDSSSGDDDPVKTAKVGAGEGITGVGGMVTRFGGAVKNGSSGQTGPLGGVETIVGTPGNGEDKRAGGVIGAVAALVGSNSPQLGLVGGLTQLLGGGEGGYGLLGPVTGLVTGTNGTGGVIGGVGGFLGSGKIPGGLSAQSTAAASFGGVGGAMGGLGDSVSGATPAPPSEDQSFSDIAKDVAADSAADKLIGEKDDSPPTIFALTGGKAGATVDGILGGLTGETGRKLGTEAGAAVDKTGGLEAKRAGGDTMKKTLRGGVKGALSTVDLTEVADIASRKRRRRRRATK